MTGVRRPLVALSYATVSSATPKRLVEFYGALLGQDITYDVEPFTVIGDRGHAVRMAFQQMAGVSGVPVHVDMNVTDLDAAARKVAELGGRLGDLHNENESTWRQAFDPDGNVFCLLLRPES